MDRWQETISENLASASVPGFKKQDFSFAAKQAGLVPGSTNAASGAHQGTHPLLMPTGSATTNFQPGEFRMTGVKTDVAIDGRGFFEVQLPNGQNVLTRDGEFHVSSQGQLVTKEGYTVMGGRRADPDRPQQSHRTFHLRQRRSEPRRRLKRPAQSQRRE